MNADVIQFDQPGGPAVLSLRSIELRPPGDGEVQILHTAIGVNLIDTYHRRGVYPVSDFPAHLGVEACGVVTAVGDDVEHLRPGDRVAYGGSARGAYSTARNVSADRVVAVPDDVDDRTAAATMTKGMTVEFLIHRTFAVQPGHTVLWHAAAGGVGILACQWLAAIGATVIGTMSSHEKAERAKSAGCTHTIVYTEEDFVERVGELTDDVGVDVAYDSVGKDTFGRSLLCLRPRGMLVGFGNASGLPDPIDPMELARNGSLYMTRPSLFEYTRLREDLELSARRVFAAVADGTLRVDIEHEWPLAEAAEAHRALEGRATTGPIVLIP